MSPTKIFFLRNMESSENVKIYRRIYPYKVHTVYIMLKVLMPEKKTKFKLRKK